MDLGDRCSHVCVVDGEEVIERFTVETVAVELRQAFARWRGARVLIEAGTHSPWVSRLLAALGLRVAVANPNRLALVTRSQRKTDRNDAETLARLAGSSLGLVEPIEHRSEAQQVDLEMLKARDVLVRARTMLVNHVRGASKSLGARLPASDTDTFAQNAAGHVPAPLRRALRPLLTEIRSLTRSIRRFDAKVKALCRESYPETSLLQAVDGVGPVTSLAFVLVVGDPSRFRHSRRVGSYLGLCPALAQSGDADPQMRITKAGNGFLRRLLVQSAHYILGPFGKDCTLRRVGERLALSGGRRGKKRAVVAVARRLAVMLHRMLATGEVYDPLRDAPSLPSSPGRTPMSPAPVTTA
jgi:transposase